MSTRISLLAVGHATSLLHVHPVSTVIKINKIDSR